MPTGDTGRRSTVCGRKALAKYCGVPGLVDQPLIVGRKWGWCNRCMKGLLGWYNDNYTHIPDVDEVKAVYSLVFTELLAHADLYIKHMPNANQWETWENRIKVPPGTLI